MTVSDLRGVVVAAGRGTLPSLPIHGRPLHEHSVRALRALPGLREVVVLVDPEQRGVVRPGEGRDRAVVADSEPWWRDWDRSGRPGLVLLDPLCPLVPAGFLREAVARAGEGRPVLGYRPVTDTVKTVRHDLIEDTLDRESLGVVTSPVVVPRWPARGLPPVADFAVLAQWLRARTEVRFVKAPFLARRVVDEGSVRVLESLDELAHQVHEA